MTPAEGSRYCNVAVPHTRLGELTYRYAAADCPGLAPGDCVRVRLRGRRVRAVVLSLAERSPVPRTQAIEELVEPGLVPAELLRLLSWANAYYFGKWGASLGMALPRGVCGYGLRARPSPPVVRDAPPGPELRPELAAAVSRRRFGVWLSCSVKGRTRLLAGYVAAVRRHGSAIVLVPEPGLARVRAELGTMCGEAVVEYHGGQGAAMRKQVWRRLRSGERQVVVGVRAAVFSPVADLAGIVVLDEHDKSFKEERHPRYSARDMAVVRGRLAGCPVLLHDRVPSVETWHNARAGRYVLLDSPDIGFAHADVRVVDMRRHRGEILSPLLVRELGRCRVSSLGAVLYVNRRGFARHVACEECGETLVCGTCGVAMVLGADRALTCPFCATRIQAPDQCPVCASRTFTYRAPGIEMVAGEVAKLLTGVEVITVQSEDGPASAVKAGAVTVGTRTLLGQPWPAQLGVVAVVNADDDLCRPDFRSREQTFRTVSQLAQRATEAGAGLIVQTRRPNDISVCTAAEGQTEGFLDAEVESRRQLGFPPFSRVALIELHGGSDAAASAHAARLSRLLGRLRGVEVLGPVRAPGRGSRFRMLVRIRPDMRLDALVGRGALETAGLRVQVDVDPLDLGWSA